MEPQLIGYFPKRTMKRPDWLKSAGVKEICSVSDCISKAPDDWINCWKHNEMWCYNSPELAESVVPEEERTIFDLYAYRPFPCRFTEGNQEALEISKVETVPLSAGFKLLGYDVVGRNDSVNFECSPLSCNAMADEIEVNEYCLLKTERLAFEIAKQFSSSKVVEPGSYVVVEVFRKM